MILTLYACATNFGVEVCNEFAINKFSDLRDEWAEFDLYIAEPESATKALPAILIYHAWDGLNAPIENIAQRVARSMYILMLRNDSIFRVYSN